MNACPHCDKPVFRAEGGKAKLGRTIVVLHKGGDLEVNCPHCRSGIVVGRLESVALRKATPRLIIRTRALDT